MSHGTEPVWGHDGLAADLASHLRTDGAWLTWLDMAPEGRCRPDVLALRRWSYNSPEMVAYEVKVSVADLRSDLTSGKWQKYLEFTQGVTFAVPHGLCKLAELPAGVGLMLRSDRGWRTQRRPTLTPMSHISVQMWLRLVNCRPATAMIGSDPKWAEDHWQRRETESRTVQKISTALGKRYGKDIAQLLAYPERAREIIKSAKADAELIVKQARDSIESDKKEIVDTWRALTDILGLKPDAKPYEISMALKTLRTLSNQNSATRFIVQKIQAAQADLNEALLLERIGR